MAEKSSAGTAPPSSSAALPGIAASGRAAQAMPTVRSNLSVLVIAVVAITSIICGGAGVWYLSHGRSAKESESQVVEAALTVVHLEGFTVNLADPEDNHFLRITIELGLDRMPPSAERDKPASGLPMARIRDNIMTVLTVCKAETLLSPEGKQQLKNNLKDAVNRGNPELHVREVYFTEFLVQR